MEEFEPTRELFVDPERRVNLVVVQTAEEETIPKAVELAHVICDFRMKEMSGTPEDARIVLVLEKKLKDYVVDLLLDGVFLYQPSEVRRLLHANLPADFHYALKLVDPSETGYGPDEDAAEYKPPIVLNNP